MRTSLLTGVCAILTFLSACAAPRNAATPLDQPPPGTTPELFAPGVVNTDAIEINGAVSPRGDEFFFARRVDGVFTLHASVRAEGGWSTPAPLDVYGDERALAVDMAYAPDGDTLYFLGGGEHGLFEEEARRDVWMIERTSEGWSRARLVPPPVSTPASESYPCVVADGSLYFSTRRAGSLGASDVFRAQSLPGGAFAEPTNLGPPVNDEASQGDTYVAPDESYLIVTTTREDSLGRGDLYVSFRTEDGGWTEPRNLGPEINSPETDFCPMVTPDGRYLFFSRRYGASWDEVTECEIYWVDTAVIERLRP